MRLEEAFILKKKYAAKGDEIETMFNKAMSESKYAGIEIPDEVVEVLDYGRANMTFERFIEIMDEELENSNAN